MAKLISLLSSAGLGAGLMYYFDPDRGRRRRSLFLDQTRRRAAETNRVASVVRRDVANRMQGMYAESQKMFHDEPVSDEKLVARIRSQLGRYVAYPGAIQVAARDGEVTLSGHSLSADVEMVLKLVESIGGVRQVVNRLEVHDSPENIADLQGVQQQTEGCPQASCWSPATRALAGIAGGALVANCLAKRTPSAALLGTLGFGLGLRAATNMDCGRLFGYAPGRRGLDARKTIVIHAPVERVFNLLSDAENFPHFTSTVKSVQCLGENRVQKMVTIPGGREVVLEERITRREPNEFFAWESDEQSAIQYEGTARFSALDDNATRIDVWMTYNPPGGVLGHSVAHLMGFDPKSQMNDVLMRAKSYLETGRQPHDAADRSPLDLDRHEKLDRDEKTAAPTAV